MAYMGNKKNLVDAQNILKKATKVLKKYYAALEKQLESALIQKKKGQEKHHAKQEPPEAEFNAEGQSDQGNKVIEMLEFITKETEKEEKTADKDEEDAQKE